MITLKEPIQLKNRSLCMLGDSFGIRIRENYEQLSSSIEADDLLHVVTSSPEIFYAEGNQTSIFNRNLKIENINENKINILNQLINRILVSNKSDFCYQDRIFITSTLRKLGIVDEKHFMKNVFLMMEEIQTQTKKYKELSSRVEVLRERIPEVMDSIKKHSETSISQDANPQSGMYLSNTIYNRLQTDRIYDTVWNFNNNYLNEQSITKKEISISEQKNSSTLIKLNDIAMNITGAPVEMVHMHQGFFEESNFEDITQLNEESVKKELVENALFSMIQQIYMSRNSKIENGVENSYNLTQAMFESAQNTFTRYVENIISPIQKVAQREQDSDLIVTEVLNYLENQTNTYNNDELIVNKLEEVNRQNVDNTNQYIRIMQQLRERKESKTVHIPNAASRAIKESLDALDNPAPLLFKYKEEQEQAADRAKEEKEMLLTAYPERIRPILRYIDRIVSKEGEGAINTSASNDALAILNADIAQIEMAHKEDSLKEVPENNSEITLLVEELAGQFKEKNKGEILQNVTQIIKQSNNANNQYINSHNQTTSLMTYLQNNELYENSEYTTERRLLVEQLVNKLQGKEGAAGLQNITNQIKHSDNSVNYYHKTLQNADDISAVSNQKGARGNNAEYNAERNILIEQILEQIGGNKQTTVAKESIENTHLINRNLNLIHKVTDIINEEEILERIDELRNESRETHKVDVIENSDVITNINRVNQEEKITTETLNETEINEIVRQQVISQMGDLSDQVFSRIEKKLQNEKIRRGY